MAVITYSLQQKYTSHLHLNNNFNIVPYIGQEMQCSTVQTLIDALKVN